MPNNDFEEKKVQGESVSGADEAKEGDIFFSSDETENVPENDFHTATNEMEAIFDELRSETAIEGNPSESSFDDEEKKDDGFAVNSLPLSPTSQDAFASEEDIADSSGEEYDLDSLNDEEPEENDNTSKGSKRFKVKNKNKSKANNKSTEKPERAKLSFWQGLLRFIIVMACFGIILGCVVGVLTALYLADATAEDNKVLDINQIKLSYATRLMAYDKEKEEWYEYERLYSDENRLWVEYGDLPQSLIKAVVASEDQRFWTHHGVDWKRTAFGFINEYIYRMSESTQGGSTITQQLIKNITSDKAVSGIGGVLRKLREIYRALELEKNYSKEQILEAYLNTVGLGDQVAGIEAAANYYFGKHASDLTMAESAAIICVTKYPSAYNPYLNPDENHRQRNFVLYNMYDYGMITEKEYNMAKAESDAMVFDEANKSTSSGSKVYSFFTDAVIEQVLDDFMNIKGMTYSEAFNELFQGGLTIYLTMDPMVQETVEATAFDKELWPELEYEEDGVTPKNNQIEAAMVVMNYDGEVLGIAGGIREKTVSRSLNRAFSPRQTGSSMKPLAVYAPALELKKIHYSSLIFDQPYNVDENGKPWPRNFSNTYGNSVTVFRGVAQSLNTTAVWTMNLIGADFSFDFLTSSLGFTTLVDSRWDEARGMYLTDRTYSMGLGGLTDGCTVLEMTAAYAIFGDGGVYTTPHFYTQICDKSGDVMLDKTRYITKSAAISEETAEIMNYMLRGVISEGTGTRARYDSKMPLCGKSGTSSDNNDYWFMGLNPYYVCGVWMGYDLNGPMLPYSIHFDTQYAWRNIMSTISEGLETKEFPTTGNIVRATFCVDSGDFASEACPNTRTGYYTRDNMPTATCIHNPAYWEAPADPLA